MRKNRILSLIWIVCSLGVYVAASQNWYSAIEPLSGVKSVVSTGLETFPLLAVIPWIAILCLTLVWYFGSVGKLMVAGLTVILALGGAGQLLLQTQSYSVLLGKIEKATGITQTVHSLPAKTDILFPRYTAVVFLLALAVVSFLTMARFKSFARKPKNPETKSDSAQKPNQSLWDEQSE